MCHAVATEKRRSNTKIGAIAAFDSRTSAIFLAFAMKIPAYSQIAGPSSSSSVLRGFVAPSQVHKCSLQASRRRLRRAGRHVLLPPLLAQQGADGELDLVERFVGRLFGKQALDDPNPGGLKRLSEEASKELYPAVTDAFAQPLDSDDQDVALLRPLLAQTQLESAPLRLAFCAQRDGWSAAAFHECVDSFGAALVVMETVGGAVVGGYNPRGWIGLGEDSRDSIAAFLFTWRDGDLAKRPVKLPKVGGASQAVIRDQPGMGIFFGPDGLAVPLAPGKERLAKCKLGPYYARIEPGGGRSLFAEGESMRGTELASLRAYVAEGAGEEWQLDGIVWKTRTRS